MAAGKAKTDERRNGSGNGPREKLQLWKKWLTKGTTASLLNHWPSPTTRRSPWRSLKAIKRFRLQPRGTRKNERQSCTQYGADDFEPVVSSQIRRS